MERSAFSLVFINVLMGIFVGLNAAKFLYPIIFKTDYNIYIFISLALGGAAAGLVTGAFFANDYERGQYNTGSVILNVIGICLSLVMLFVIGGIICVIIGVVISIVMTVLSIIFGAIVIFALLAGFSGGGNSRESDALDFLATFCILSILMDRDR